MKKYINMNKLSRIITFLTIITFIVFFHIQKISAYYQKNVTTVETIVTQGFENLSISTNKTEYGMCSGSTTVILTVTNSNDYKVGYTISLSNSSLSYTVGGSAPASYTIAGNATSSHSIIISGTPTATSLNVVVTSNSPYGTTVVKTITFDMSCPVCTWAGVTSTNNYLRNGAITIYTLTCTDSSGITSDNLTSSAFTVSNSALASISSITKSAVTNGYKYTISLLGKTGDGTITISLKANAVKDNNLNGNAAKTSGIITVDNTAPSLVLDKEGVVEGFKGWDLGSAAVIDENGYLGFTSETSAISYYYPVDESYYYWTFEATATSASTQSTPNGGWYTGTNYYDANFAAFTGSNGNSGNGQAGSIPLNTWKLATTSNYNYGEGLEYFRIRLRGNSPYANVTTKYRNFKVYGNIFAKSKYTIKVTASDANNVVLKKYASGSQTVNYFTSGGTTFTSDNFDVTSNGTYTVYLKDTAGNETVQTIVINKIDNAAPTISSFTQNSAWGTTNKLTATATDSLAGIVAYAFTSANVEPTSWTRVNNTTSAKTVTNTVSKNGTYYVWFIDSAGNVSSASATVNKIDVAAPTCVWTSGPSITYLRNATTSTYVLTCTDNIGLSDSAIASSDITIISTNDASVTIGTPTKSTVTGGYAYTFTLASATGNGTIKLKINAGAISDAAGNSNAETLESTLVTIDNILPTISYNLAEGTYNSAQTITVTPSDTGGSDLNYYKVDVYKNGTKVNGYDNLTSANYSVTLSEDATWIVYTYVVDNAGNVIAEMGGSYPPWNYKTYTIDTKSTITFDNNYAANNLWTETLDTSKYYNYSTPFSIAITNDSTPTVNLTMESGTLGGVYFLPTAELTAGVQYTWSIIIKSNAEKGLQMGNEQGGVKGVWVTTSWQKVTHTFTAETNGYKSFIFYIAGGSAWTEGDVISFQALEIQEGAVPSITTSQSKTIGSAMGTLPSVSSTGYTFAGWYTLPTGGTKITTTTVVPNKNTTYYAQWKSLPVITQVSYGGLLSNDPTFASGTNGTMLYNNLDNGIVTNERVSMTTHMEHMP